MKNFKNILYVIELIFVFITTILGTAYLIAAFRAAFGNGYYMSLICYICSLILCNSLFSILKKLMQKENKNE
ncbi:hypothetical protein [Metaclostridioides mangenotii]|uniref:hypothetical protein n=1 Tax=Metaclostridioides mangenotii TaxID=1540 RepID=UPI0026F20390|nr:hypothetical protein [Clostridioides mangenotii]